MQKLSRLQTVSQMMTVSMRFRIEVVVSRRYCFFDFSGVFLIDSTIIKFYLSLSFHFVFCKPRYCET